MAAKHNYKLKHGLETRSTHPCEEIEKFESFKRALEKFVKFKVCYQIED